MEERWSIRKTKEIRQEKTVGDVVNEGKKRTRGQEGFTYPPRTSLFALPKMKRILGILSSI